jgi:hypothetical protein
VSGQFHAPAALPSVPVGKEIEWTPEPVWTMLRRENSLHYRDSNSDNSVVQLFGNCYTDYAIPVPQFLKYYVKIMVED